MCGSDTCVMCGSVTCVSVSYSCQREYQVGSQCTVQTDRDGKLGMKIGPDWPIMGQISDFLRSVSVHFGAGRLNVLTLIFKSPRFVPFEANLTQFGCQI